jgi:RimJ/RimL family protein N-acetyltransferase
VSAEAQDNRRVAPGRNEPVPAVVSLSTLCDALESAQWSPRALEQWLPGVIAHAYELPPDARIAWLLRLREAARHAWAAPLIVRQALMRLADAWCDWPLLLAVGEGLEDAGESPEWAGPLQVAAQLRLGASQAALSRCRTLALLRPRDRWASDTHDALQRWMCFVDRIASPIVGESLRLEPMGHHHAGDFAWQYYDPAIGERCCLPAFADHAHWHRWLDQCWGYGDQRIYAVIHPEWGFIGSVSLILRDGIGFFYYWLGRDFQGYGLGPAAARLLLDDARLHRGIATCYAKVFEDNAPSRRALEKLGFDALDFCPAPPNGHEVLYRLGSPQCREDSVEELRTLFERMGSDTRVAVPCSMPGSSR